MKKLTQENFQHCFNQLKIPIGVRDKGGVYIKGDINYV